MWSRNVDRDLKTLFFPMFAFDPPENRKPKVFLMFQGDQKKKLGSKGLREKFPSHAWNKLIKENDFGKKRPKSVKHFTVRKKANGNSKILNLTSLTETYSEFCQLSKMELFLLQK